jgi:hypothetical protein
MNWKYARSQQYAGSCLADIEEDQEVFAEDLGKKQPESSCIKLGDSWYSKDFYKIVEMAMNGLEKNSQDLLEMAGEFLNEGDVPALKNLNVTNYALLCHAKTLRTFLELINIEPEQRRAKYGK